jgi:Zn-dependent peptidase ImmA (M78 family)
MAMLTDEEKRLAEETAKAVLNDTFSDIELVEFPVDLNAILEKYGLILREGNFEDPNISGAFSRADNTIFVSARENPERQMFTVAHEIGHYKLHESRTTDILYRKNVWQFGNNGLEKDETQANWFAANLLMPPEAVKRMWKITPDVTRLSGIFGVSKTAMSFRLKDLGLIKN